VAEHTSRDAGALEVRASELGLVLDLEGRDVLEVDLAAAGHDASLSIAAPAGALCKQATTRQDC
jgi:hypothetical protein